MAISFFKVNITPLKNANTYGDPVDVTEFVTIGGIGVIKEQIDSGEYDIGLYTYAALNITLVNFDGLFNDEKTSSTMFCYARDRAKVEIEFTDEESGATILFKGLINDEATKQDFNNSTVKVKVLSQDSILRKTKVAGGLLNNGDTFSAALKALLNRPTITNILGFDPGKISVGIDLTLDDVTAFNDKDTREVLEDILNASLSVFTIDSNNDMVVSTRAVKAIAPLELFGGGDLLGRNNAIKINKFNDGLQRTFNVITVNNQTATDDAFVERYGARIKEFDFDFITSSVTALLIAEAILSEFKAPKQELEVLVTVDTAKNKKPLDPVNVSWSKLYKKWRNINRVPIAGVAIAGADVVPFSAGGITIRGGKSWKITGITQNPRNFLTTLRLREV